MTRSDGGHAPRSTAVPDARRARTWLVFLLVLHAALLAWAATSNSVTFDEFGHLPAGLAYWKYGDFSIYCVSPPLVRLWSAVPALLAGAETPPIYPIADHDADGKHWAYGRLFEMVNRPRYHTIFVIARLGMIPISCLAAWIVYRWAYELFGPTAGLAACAFYCLCPNVAAHGSLVTTDVATTTAMLASLWLWRRYCEEPKPRRAAAAAVTIGIAQLCKFTALFLWPILLMTVAAAALGHDRVRRKRLTRGFAAAVLISMLFINATYGFQGTGAALSSYQFGSRTMSVFSRLPGWVPVPLPRDYVVGFDVQKKEAEGAYVAFALGESYLGARWYYYPVALFCKLPIVTMLCGAAALVVALRRIIRGGLREKGTGYLLACLSVVSLGMALLAEINIGLRYLLPAFPLGFILIGGLWRNARRGSLAALAIALILLAAENISVAPRYLTFFNQAVGGPEKGYLLLNDSNFDWGQDLMKLKAWMDQHSVRRIGLCYFGSVDPGVYGIDYTPVTQTGSEAYVAVSSYFLVGIGHRLPLPMSWTEPIHLPFHAELRRKEPVAVVGSTIFVYRRSDFEQAATEKDAGR